MASTFIPAYRDTYCEYSGDSLSFYVMTEGVIVFTGKAVKSPNEEKIRINVNKIAKDYLSQSLEDQALTANNQVFEHSEAFRVFHFYRNDGVLLQTYGVLFDWGIPFSGNTTVLSDPITPHISKYMKAVYTVYNSSGVTIDVDEEPIVENTYFELLTKSVVFPYSGGTQLIRFNTDYYPPSSISAYTTSTAYTLSNLTYSSVEVTSTQNTGTTLIMGEIVFTYGGMEMGWDTANLVTIRNETPVSAITWDSGITVNRPCWNSVPFDDSIYFPGTLSNFKKEAARTSNAECEIECPYRFTASEDWVHFYPYDGENWTTGYKFKSWPLIFTCDDNTESFARTATINTYSGDTLLKTTTLTQWPSGNTTTEPVWENDSAYYSYYFADFGPYDSYPSDYTVRQLVNSSLTLGYYSSLDFDVIYPDGSRTITSTGRGKTLSKRGTVVELNGQYYIRVWTKVPATYLSSTGRTTYTTQQIRTVPKQVTYIGHLTFNAVLSAVTVYYTGTVEEWRRIPKEPHTTTGLYDVFVQCIGARTAFSSVNDYIKNGESGMELCSDCGRYIYEYPKNSGDPTSVDIIYSGSSSSVTSNWECYDEYDSIMTPVSHTFNNGLGTITYPRPPYRLNLNTVSPCYRYDVNYLISGSLRELGGVRQGSRYTKTTKDSRLLETPLLEKVDILVLGVLPLDCTDTTPITAASMSFNNVVSGTVDTDVVNAIVLLPNVKYAQIGGAGFETTHLFIPSAKLLRVPVQSYRITELIIGPTMEEIRISGNVLLTELTELCFNAPSDVFYDWLNTGMHRYDVIDKMPALQVIHCLDADIHWTSQ